MSRSSRFARPFSGALATSLMILAVGAPAHATWPLKLGPNGEYPTVDDAKNPANWPNDPNWGYLAADKPKDRRKGQWEYFGFQPDRSLNAPPLRAAEVGKACGGSMDLAWSVTIGDPRIVVAILDSGPKWDEKDIANKAYLNMGELEKFKPKKKDGSACGGKGIYAGWDCNGDDAFSVNDYLDDQSLKPDAVTHMDAMGNVVVDKPRGDKNNNGILDAGDLILNFSDGVDDDGNGYVDDISGWDFLMDDNDPYEDTRYYHGTNQAKDAAAETNNGIGGVGVCPLCRFISLRVGDSFVADSNDYAQAVVYAADMKVASIECALGTINLSTYAQRAVEYAWKNNVIVTGSMADENSKHHNMPNTANYVLSAHSIINNAPDGDVTSADTFLFFEPGSNYGGQNYLSTTTEAASSGAAGVNSGVAALIQSAAIGAGSYPLSAGEVFQLFTMTADDIDVPESRMADARYYWSQPGFDQRFGYGRTNAFRAVSWVREGKIPPEVTVLEPQWFENLYRDRVKGPVELKGIISAKRAMSYDYVVEWGPGVQPLETEWKKIPGGEGSNIAGSTVTGESSPLALIDLTTIDPKHERDKDSPSGENDNAFTVRVRATAHYGGKDVPGEYRRTYYVHTDPGLLPGFPIRVNTSLESSPKLADLDGDGRRDIIQADSAGLIHAWKVTPEGPVELPGFPFKTKPLDGLEATPSDGAPSYLKAKGYQPGNVNPAEGREGFFATVAVADMDGDGKLEIAAATWQGSIYVIEGDGSVRPGWPRRMPYVPSCALDPTKPKLPQGACMAPDALVIRGAAGSPVLIDMNNDGKLDLVQAGFDGKIYVYDAGGNLLDGWPVAPHYDGRLGKANEYGRIFTTPAVADLNGDGIPEILTGSNEKLGDEGSGAYYVIDGRGTKAPSPVLPNWPITVTSLHILPIIGEGATTSGVFADFDGDGRAEAVFHGNSSPPIISPVDPGLQSTLNTNPPNAMPKGMDDDGTPRVGLSTGIFGERSKARHDTMFPLFAQPSLGDLDLDGTVDVIAAGGSLSLAANLGSKGSASTLPSQFMVGMWSGRTGRMMPASPILVEDYLFTNSQAVADLSGDGFPEVLTGSGAYLLRAVDACGREAPGFPKNTGQWIMATTALGDLDGDGKLEVVVGTRDGWLYAWHTEGKADGVIQWESWHHDNQNTGNYATKLTQGVPFKASGPLDCDKGNTLAGPAAEDDSGCGCEIPGKKNGATGAALALAALGAAALFLRRRRN